MELRLLGPMEVFAGGQFVDVGPPRQRLVLAMLAAEAGRPVSIESLVDRLWDEPPPEHPRRTLQVYVSRLRGRLAAAATSDRPPVGVVRRSGSYLLDLDPNRVDVHRFRRLVNQARGRACPEPERVALLGQALQLWRGPPLADLPGRWAVRVRQGWQEQHLETVVVWALASLRVGDSGAVLPRLTELVGERPLVESLAAAYMRALYAAGRPTDALEHYFAMRHRLANELGTDPGPELQKLHRQILSADPVLAPRATIPAPRSSPAPRQLPAPPPMFTGRASELATIDQLDDSSTVVITAIDGMAGVGKTALAVHAAHRIADRYPDGQLFIDLHGYTQGVEPVEPAEALDHLLRALGIAGEQIPTSLEQRTALYRTRLADQRMLIVLDNAAVEAQVERLLPGSPGCRVLVTSRHRLAGLDLIHTLSLDTLPVPEAVDLFTHAVGEGRLAGQPHGRLAELVELCGRLPLALRIAAARLRAHPTWTLSHLVERLRDQRHRLAELEAGQRSVTAALDLSYQHLPSDQQRTYRWLGLHPGFDIDEYAAAALLDSTTRHTCRLLDRLLEAHLLQERAPGRYRFHDLTRAHAAHIAARDDTQPDRDAALGRLLDHYRHSASHAMDAAYPYDRQYRPRAPSAHTPVPGLSDPATAADWLDAELPNLLAAARYCADRDWPEHVGHLSTILHRHLYIRGRYHDAETLQDQALLTARAAGHQAGELDALIRLGRIHLQQNRHESATDHYQQALQLAHTINHPAGELEALTGLGWIHRLQGRYDQAANHHQRAGQIARTINHHPGELDTLTGLGNVRRLQARYDQAADHYHLALQLARTINHPAGELEVLIGLAWIHRLRGRYDQAASHYQQALQIARTIGQPNGELNALTGLGNGHRSQGRYDQAADHYQQALQIARTIGQRNGELNALTGLGNARRLQGRYDQAADHYQQALQTARTIGQPNGELTALTGLGHIHRLQGRYEQGNDHYRRVLNLARKIGDRNYEFEAELGMGRLRLATGDPDAGITHHGRALTLAGELGHPTDQARAHDGLAHAHHTLNQHQRAHSHWQHTLNILTRLGVDHTLDEETTAAAVRAHLARLDKQQTR